jgi:hypothetical protein
MRQMELGKQMGLIEQELRALKREASSASSVRRTSRSGSGEGTEGGDDVGDMKEQIRLMKEQIARLQMQQQSAWAQGYSDEPPPGYSLPSSPTDIRTD